MDRRRNELEGLLGKLGLLWGSAWETADAATFLREAHPVLSLGFVNTCILSNKIQLVRLFWAVWVMQFLCCGCSED